MEFVVARNPDPQSSLPFLVHIPLGADGIVLKVRDVWPRVTKLYCHRAGGWPDGADIVDRVAVRSCARRGAAIDLVLDRGRENRSQFVFTKARGREVIFWQSARTARQARPNVSLPTARAPPAGCSRSSSTPMSAMPGGSATSRRRWCAGRWRQVTTRSAVRTATSSPPSSARAWTISSGP